MIVWRSKWDLSPAQLRTFAKTSANIPVLMFVGWVALSAILSPFKVFSVQYLLQIGAGAVLYFAVAYQFRQSKHLSMLADVLLFLAAVVSFAGMALFQLNDQLRASAIFGNPQPLGSFVMLLLPVVASLALGDKNAKRKTVAQITVVMMIGCLIATQSRSAWMGSIAGLAMLALLSSRVIERTQGKSGRGVSLKARKDQFVLPGMLAVVAVGFVFAMNSVNGSFASRAATATRLGSDVSAQARIQSNWAGAVKMIAESPILGHGAGTFAPLQHKYTGQGVELSQSLNGARGSLAEQAHSFYLQTTAELGLIGMGLMLAVLGCFWMSAWNRIPQMEAGIRRTLLMASAAASVGFAADAITSPSWQFAQLSMFLWLVMGIGTSCLRPRVRTESEVVAVQFAAPSRRTSWVARPAAVALLLGVATLLPSAFTAARADGYNNGNDDDFKVAFGLAVAAGVLDMVFHHDEKPGNGPPPPGGTNPGGQTPGGPNTTTQTLP
jgi:O-antigen ligase